MIGDTDRRLLTRKTRRNSKTIVPAVSSRPSSPFSSVRTAPGRSHLLEALRFAIVALRSSLDDALCDRGVTDVPE